MFNRLLRRCSNNNFNDYDINNNSKRPPSNPNTQRLCGIDIWSAECLLANKCYTYVRYDTYAYYNDDTFDYSYEDYECEYTLSTVCDPNFRDTYNDGCEAYNRRVGGCAGWTNDELFKHGVYSPAGGVMTGLTCNCPVCGCGEDGPIRMGER